MTRVRVRVGAGRCLLEMEGHATGSPAVCAACSALAYALAGYLANAELPFACTLESGHVRIACRGDAEAAFAMAWIGLAQIAKRYPALVHVEEDSFFSVFPAHLPRTSDTLELSDRHTGP